ncbi:hypothetical protein QLX67_07695 [Balneolaceae bacterium ANBcel3]|nr:hypothetical protein [Balneolaceae bacterium ANBcel3]
MGLAFFVFLIQANHVTGQMFSVEEVHTPRQTTYRSIFVGLDHVNMVFRGSDSEADFPLYYISEPVYHIGFDATDIQAHLSIGRDIGGGVDGDTLNYINFSASFSNAIPLYMRSRTGLLLPTKLMTDFTRVTSAQSSLGSRDEFNKSAVLLGLGLRSYVRFSEKIRLELESIPQIGFSISALGADSGGVFSVNSGAKLWINEAFGRFGVLFRYEYGYTRYSGEERYNYNIDNHRFGLGLVF